ncbi:craniofacial development protein 1 [Daktulosphaira vitifoliae]|uniref:craniofacial development protein 1 n=1 Tax=Daktulosphaira vitifoliae TaxID=58002 RepID=UPI0021AA34F4|nr:craniofacial development protein 1 [Daktulosphaira vitifoliae]XP_050538505.1 craniofacial development protein 1 [Daktulosphaira vitifoliae]
MNFQDCSDSDDSSDLDYRPLGGEENLSEVDSDDSIDSEDISYNKSSQSKKRTKKHLLPRKKTKIKGIENFDEKNLTDNIVSTTKSEEEKKRLEALWEDFQRPAPKKSSINNSSKNEVKYLPKEPIKNVKKSNLSLKRDFEEMFDNTETSKRNESNNDVQPNEQCSTKIPSYPVVKKNPSGLTNVLSQLEKKNKLTVLEKSKQDWDDYKKEEGIVEELVTFNKGKDGYLEKRDFLERTDLRQFELEKAMRSANRLQRH